MGIWQRIGGALALLALIAAPAWASDQVTLNDTAQTGVKGVLLASPPGSCTAAPGGELGDCLARGAAATAAAAGTAYFTDTTWSDLREADVALTENGNTEVGRATAGGAIVPDGATPQPDTDIGTSWVINFCDRPQCGHLLRGDTLQFDENGDGKFDDTWIDDGDLIVENGEIDRTRGEQFTWGVTSVTRDLTDLSDQLADGNLFPAGVARIRVRMALGDASQAGTCDAHIDNPDCLDGDLNPVNAKGVDGDYWAKCDPDRFNPATTNDPTITTVAEGQLALDNCLWWITSLPILSVDDLATQAHDAYLADTPFTMPDGHDMEQRTIWVDQSVLKPVYSSTPDAQDFAESVYVTYGFEKIPELDEARYQNGWQILQQDRDPNEAVNGNINPYNGNFMAAPAGPAKDTYPYAFAIEHYSVARARGEDNDGNVVAECPGVNCDGKTNPTFDPFWHEQLVKIALVWEERWNHNFEYVDGEPCDEFCRGSGVGEEHGFSFLTAQDVNGYFETCVGCQPNTDPLEAPPVEEVHYMPYVSGWQTVPTVIHSP